MRKSTRTSEVDVRGNRPFPRISFHDPRAVCAETALNTDSMKHPALTLLVLAAVLVPWMAVVALADWVRRQVQGRQDALGD